MNRGILIKVTAPTVVIGLLLGAAHELQNTLRRLHFHCFNYLVDPDPAVHKQIVLLDTEFEAMYETAGGAAHTPEERACVERIRAGFSHYRKEFERLKKEAEC